MLLWPCHLLAFKILKIPISSNLRALVPLLAQHYAVSPPSSSSNSALPSTQDFPFPLHAQSQRDVSLKTPWVRHLLRKVALLTIFISFPALSWYASVPLTSMADLTAIYNVFAFVCLSPLSNYHHSKLRDRFLLFPTVGLSPLAQVSTARILADESTSTTQALRRSSSRLRSLRDRLRRHDLG